jgi:hypothetical protein
VRSEAAELFDDQASVRDRLDEDRLLEPPVEQHPTPLLPTSVEAGRDLG